MIVTDETEPEHQFRIKNLNSFFRSETPTPSDPIHSIRGHGNKSILQNSYPEIDKIIRDFFNNIQHIEKHRLSDDSVSANETRVIHSTGSSLLNELATIQDDSRDKYNKFEQNVNKVSSTITTIHNPMRGSKRILLVSEAGLDNKIAHSALSSGYHQILILANIIAHSANDPILLEEPELHLNAKTQKQLLKLIRDDGNKQFFIETHSPIFVGTSDSEATFLVSKHKGIGSVIPVLDDMTKQIKYELGLGYSDIFEHSILYIVEGESEYKAFPIISKKLGYNLESDVRLFNMHGFGNLKNIVGLLDYLKDSDKQISILLDENKEAKKHVHDLIAGNLDPMQNAPDAANHKITSELRWAWPYLKIPPATYFTNLSCSSM